MTPKDQKGNNIVAFTVGAFIGAGIALFLAPQSGKKTRRDVGRLGKKALNKSQALRLELSRSIDNMADGVWERLQEELERGRDWTQDTIADVQRALEAGKDFIGREIDKVRRS